MWYPDIQPAPKEPCVLIPAPAFYLLSGQKEFNSLSQFNCVQYDNNITYLVVEESKLVVMCTLCSKDIEQNMNLVP